ncbi:hypothetical protein GPZ77_13330 [Streptomyces sp. QHH-9511]|nr:hypothetical protein GPZ77_13330 [Streptomyces sp. QHH-9511]
MTGLLLVDRVRGSVEAPDTAARGTRAYECPVLPRCSRRRPSLPRPVRCGPPDRHQQRRLAGHESTPIDAATHSPPRPGIRPDHASTPAPEGVRRLGSVQRRRAAERTAEPYRRRGPEAVVASGPVDQWPSPPGDFAGFRPADAADSL